MSLVAFVDAFDGADGQDDGHDEEEDASDDAGRHRLLFQPFWQREGGFLAGCLRRQRVRVDSKHVLLAHVQLFHCGIQWICFYANAPIDAWLALIIQLWKRWKSWKSWKRWKRFNRSAPRVCNYLMQIRWMNGWMDGWMQYDGWNEIESDGRIEGLDGGWDRTGWNGVEVWMQYHE